MRRVVALLVLLTASAEAMAQPVPSIPVPLYDVEARCRSGAAGLPGICIDAEQRDYDVAKWLWGTLAPDQQARCARHVQSPQPRRYAAVRGCVELEASLNDLAERQATKRFRP